MEEKEIERAKKRFFVMRKRSGVIIGCSAAVLLAGGATGTYFLTKTFVKPAQVNVTFDAVSKDAYFTTPGENKLTLAVNKGTKFSDLSKAINKPTLKYHNFKTWLLNDNHISKDYVLNTDVTFKANYEVKKTTVYFYAAGNGTGYFTKEVKGDKTFYYTQKSVELDMGTSYAEAFKNVPNPYTTASEEKDNFNGWSIDGYTPLSDAEIQEYVLDQEYVTFVALYKKLGEPIDNVSILFNSDGVTPDAYKLSKTNDIDPPLNQEGNWFYNGKAVKSFSIVTEYSDTLKLGDILEESDLYIDPEGEYGGFANWYYNTKTETGKVITADTLFKDVGKSLSLYPLYTNQGPEKDSWSAIINYANRGSSALKNHYGNDLKVGLTRKIVYDNDYDNPLTVALIGMDQDFQTFDRTKESSGFDVVTSTTCGEGFDNKIPLTFKFMDALTDKGPILEKTGTNTYGGYAPFSNGVVALESYARKFLNNDAFGKLPYNIKKGITPAQKRSCWHSPAAETYEPKNYGTYVNTEKLFLLSTAEINGLNSQIDFEGFVYSYYGSGKEKLSTQWTRTYAYDYDDQSCFYYVTNDLKTDNKQYGYLSSEYAPAFCIGTNMNQFDVK